MAPPATGLKLRYRAAAKLDIQEARDWYEAISPKLEQRFATALADTLSAILAHPRAYEEIEPQIRRALVPVFPYAIYYRLVPSAVTVLAVLHTSRHPATWTRRD